MVEVMKYKEIKIVGHQRSGSHWISRFIDINFFNGVGYLERYNVHLWGHSERSLRYLRNVNQVAVIYTYRNLDDTVDSIYRMRHRFGLDEDDFEKFKTTPMQEMFNPTIEVDAVVNDTKSEKHISDVDTSLSERQETVIEYINDNRESWLVHSDKPNFKMVNYDDMVNNFQETMLDIANFLGSNKVDFKDEYIRVGWMEKADHKWIKPEAKL